VTAAPEPRYFFIIGAMKAGTTSLFKYLAGHPDICPSSSKEPRIFRDPADPESHRAAFHALFEARRAETWCFEASTAYTKYPQFAGVPRRLQAVAPDAKFVYLVRNPVERVWSQYVHNLAHGRESAAFEEALHREPQYVETSRYHMQMCQYLDVFPRDRVLVQVFEEMVKDPAGTVRTVCEFLGVDASYEPPTGDVAYNASSEKRAAPPPLRVAAKLGADELLPWRVRHWLRDRGRTLPNKKDGLSPEVRRALADSLRPDTEAFFSLIGRRIPAWTDFA
jgi:hypothetical protein